MFFATKLFLPPEPAGAIQRDDLYTALDGSWAVQSRLMLFSAPPGYGKTTLLSNWVRSRAIPCAWVTLDDGDNDPGRFFQLLVRALKPHFPNLDDLLAALNVPQVSHLDSLFAEVINRVAQTRETTQTSASILLALDDYHTIHAQPVHNLIQTLLDHQPPQLHLAILTREDPPVALARLRARRQMLEIRARTLAFSPSEGRALLVDRLALPLADEQVNALVERTEGWAAGLQLAALALEGWRDPATVIDAFSGSHEFVLDYLTSEVLNQLDPGLRAFLCATALLDRFNAGICDAALGMAGSQDFLSRALDANLFLIPLEDGAGTRWYRYHHLIREILKAEMAPENRQPIYRRAARWWMNQGQPAEAVHYALEAKDYPIACAAIRSAAIPAAENGMLSTALGWLDAVPQAALLDEPELCVIRAWFLLFNGRFQETAAWIEQIGHLLPDLPRSLAGLLLGMQAWMRSVTGRPLDLEQLKTALAMTEGRYPYFAPMLHLAVGQAQRETGALDEALHSFEEGALLAEDTSGPVSALILRNNQAFLLNETGARRAALDLCQEGMARFTGPDGRPLLPAGIPMIPAGCFLYESGRLDEADRLLPQSINLVRRLGMYDILTGPASYILQFLLADQGRYEEALALNKDVRRWARKAGLTKVLEESEAITAWIWRLTGDPLPAENWVRTHPLDVEGTPGRLSTSRVLHARWLCDARQTERAAAVIFPIVQQARAAGTRLTWVRACVELALVHLSAGQVRTAWDALAPAAEFAAGCEYRQIFLRNSLALTPLLDRLPPNLLGPHPNPAPASRPAAPALVESLTARESEVLRLAAAGLSNAEIAERLYLTTGTVKWFMNQIFGKLGASRRTEAVARAQAAGLI